MRHRTWSVQEANGPAHLRGAGRLILHHAWNWRLHVGTLLLVVAASGCGVGQQFGLKLLVDGMAGPNRAGPTAQAALALFLGLIAAQAALSRITAWLTCRATVGIGVDLRAELFDHLSGQAMRYFAENRAGSLDQLMTAVAGHFGALVNTFVTRVLPPMVDVAGAVVIFASLDPVLTGALASMIVLVTAGLIWFGERGRPLHRAYSAEAAAIAGDLVDTIANMWTVKAFSARGREAERLGEGFRNEAAAQRRSWMYLEQARLLHDLALWALAAVILSWTLALWRHGAVSAGSVVLVASLTLRILHSSKDMALSFVEIAQQLGFIEETLTVIAKPSSVQDPPGARALAASSGSIELANVSFAYGPGQQLLCGVSLRIPAGQKVGIVGPSGAGKSTLVHLLQRLYDVDDGEIRIDGQSIAEVHQDSLREALAVVPQEISLLHRSVLENIRFARPEASDEAVLAAARAAACDGFVRLLPNGYHTLVGERGARLSGGQRQRIGIARAFLKQAPILLLDEATSALDTETEMAIQSAIVRLMRGRTVVAVAHRLSTLTSFDRVLVISDGRVVEDGTVGELRQAGRLFEQMWRLQAEGLSGDDAVVAAA